MPLVLNEEQNMLKDAAKDFCTNSTPITQMRKLRDDKDETGFDKDTWQQMVELGWAGITIPEDFGGLGFGYMGMGVVMEECGRTLTCSPLLASAVLGAGAIQHGGSDDLKGELLPQVAGGELLLALALEETPHHSPYGSATKAEKSGDAYKVTGSKKFVLDGHIADKIVVVARSSGSAGDRDGLTLVLVDREGDGVAVTRTIMADSRNAANIELSGAAGVLLGEEGKGADVLDKVLDAGRIVLAAEMLGSVQECFERTVEYLKVREQFGALSALDEDRADVAEMASLVKARLNDTYNLVSSEGVQMHGGIGMTDEHEIGFFLKRSRVSEHTMGNSAFHRDRYGVLQGY